MPLQLLTVGCVASLAPEGTLWLIRQEREGKAAGQQHAGRNDMRLPGKRVQDVGKTNRPECLAARPTRRLADNTETVPAAVRGHLPLTCREKACHPERRISCGRMGNYQEAASQPLRRDASKARPGQSEQRTPPFSTARTPYIRGDLRKRAMQKKYPPSN